ncbi:hypothetical protein OAO18_07165 [Francisellaceae bacterium]|nr:hypothetical protein [Francisellaceae bacterium]
MAVVDSLKVPHYQDDTTIWASLKDLDNEVYYFKPYGYFQGKGKFMSVGLQDIQTYDLKSIDFNDVPLEDKGYVIHPTKKSDIKEIISADKIPGFS